MDETIEKLVGIKQVLMPEFKAAEAAGTTKGYMWFVRDKNISLHNYIYLGSRLYGEAEIEIPIDSLITNITSDNSIIVTKTTTEDGSTVELKVNVAPDGGLILTEDGVAVDVSKFATKEELNATKEDIATVNTNLVTAVNAINQNMVDGFNTINGGIDNEIRPAIEELKESDAKSVKYLEFDTDRKTIQLKNHDTISGIKTNGDGVNLAMVSKWDKADFGSAQLPFNMNGSEARPTYNDDKEVALVEDVDAKVSDEANRVNSMVNVINESIKTVNDNLVIAVNTINGGIDNEIRPAIEDLQESDTKSVKYLDFDTDRKTIQLKNHDTISGVMTNGDGANLAMISKWDKADFGSVKLPFNMNGSEARPTYNDDKEVALVEDVDAKVSGESERVDEAIKTVNDALTASIDAINDDIENNIKPAIDAKVSLVELIQDADNQLHYELMVDGIKKGDINIPKDQFLKDVSYDSTTKELIFVFDTQEGEKTTKVDISELIDTYEAGNGLELTDDVFSIKLDPSSQSYVEVGVDGIKIVGVDEAVSGLDAKIADEIARAEDVEAQLKTDIAAEETRALGVEAAINTSITEMDAAYKAADTTLAGDITTLGTKVTDNETAIATKVDKVDGMGLSEENFTTVEKTKLATLDNYNDTEVRASITALDAAYKAADTTLADDIAALGTKVTANETAITNKVDKVDGMGLSTNDFTTAEKTKLAGLDDYDDTEVKASIATNTTAISEMDAAYKAADTTLADNITALDTAYKAADTELSERIQVVSDDVSGSNSRIEANETKIADLTTGLTEERTTRASAVITLTNNLNSEIARAKGAEEAIDVKVDNIINNGLILPNGKAVTARPTGETQTPVDILTLTSENKVVVGSNIGQLVLKTKGAPIVAVIDGETKELVYKDEYDALQASLTALTARVAALEGANP